jgi:hypothetical protein
LESLSLYAPWMDGLGASWLKDSSKVIANTQATLEAEN